LVTLVTSGMAVARLGGVNPRPEIVLPPGFSLRIDYDPARSPASLTVTAFQDDLPVGQAHLDPREVGLRLRLDVEGGVADTGAPAREPRLRLTPRNAALAIEMEAVHAASEPSAPVPAPEASVVSAPVSPGQASLVHTPNSVVWLEDGTAVILPSADPPAEPSAMPRLRELLHTVSERASGLLSSPLGWRLLDPQSWISWRGTWGAPPPAVAGDA
jgi:hypothetical protein